MTELVDRCPICERILLIRGVALSVEIAVAPTGEELAAGELHALKNSARRGDRERFADLRQRFLQLAARGRLEVPREMRQLRDGLMEIKTAEDRVPFYFTSPAGHPRAARLTHVFGKSDNRTAERKTPRKQIDRGIWIMNGDRDKDE